jgi:hypothetical protein
MDTIITYVVGNRLHTIALVGGLVFIFLGIMIFRKGSKYESIAAIVIGAFLILWSIGWLPQSQAIATQANPTDTPTTEPAPTSTRYIVEPTPSPQFSWDLTVPGYEEGIVFSAAISGKHKIVITGGAYSPTPSEDYPGPRGWMTTLYVYINRPVEWGLRPESGLIGPVNPDLEIGNGELRPSKEEAEEFVIGWSSVIDLQAGDELTFVPIDEKDFYDKPANNRGEVNLMIYIIP